MRKYSPDYYELKNEVQMRPDDQKFPNPGTDRRPDELVRNLRTEAKAESNLQRVQETERVADEDREASVQRSALLESQIKTDQRLTDVLALAVLLLLVVMIVAGIFLLT